MGNQKGPEERLATLQGVVGQLRIGAFAEPVHEALEAAKAAVEAIPAPEPGVTPAEVNEARKAAFAAIDEGWVILNRQQWVWCVEDTLQQRRRLDHLESARHFGPWRDHFSPLLKAWEEANRGIRKAMNFKGDSSKDFVMLCGANHRALGKAWRILKQIREAGGLKASEVFGPDGVGAKLDEVDVKIEVLVHLTNTEITDHGLSQDDLDTIRRKIPAPEEESS